jgi:SAM-dependent methyltransferase
MHCENDTTQVPNRYKGEEGRAYHQIHDVPQAAHGWIARERAWKFAPYVRPDDIVLEYGVGPGWNLEAISCRQRIGYDISTFLESLLSAKGIRFITDTREVTDASIDTIICHHVLEHTPDPHQVLKEIKRMLRDDGQMVLVVPYEKERKYRRYRKDEPNHHLYSWNVQTLGNLVGELGFSIRNAEVGKYGYDRFLAVLASRLRVGAAGFRILKSVLLAAIPLLEVRIIAAKRRAIAHDQDLE